MIKEKVFPEKSNKINKLIEYIFQPWPRTESNKIFKMHIKARSYDEAKYRAHTFMQNPVFIGQKAWK